MDKKKLILGIIIAILGVIGISTLLTMNIPLPPEAEAILKEKFTDGQIKLLSLINPTLLLLITVVVGTIFYQKVNLSVPIIEKIVGISDKPLNLTKILTFGVIGGIIAGLVISIVALLFNPILPAEFKELGESIKPTLATRFLYGGFTEEILMRFGLMTLIVWGASKLTKGTKPFIYGIGISIAAVLFALGHFPVAFQVIENPPITLLSYILIANSLGGLIFGWLYWKKGLESAFIAHIFAHVVMIFADTFIN